MLQVSVLVHIIAAMIWIGGMLFLALVVAPATRQAPPRERAALFSLVGRRFRLVGWICIGLLIVTGVSNVALHGVGWDDVVSGRLSGSEFGQVLLVKLAVVALMLVISLIHDVVIGPASSSAAANPELRARAAALRRQASWAGRANVVLGLLVIALAVALVRGLPW